jgi:hypothetical protein
MSSVWTPFFRKVERTVRIGVGIKAASLRQVVAEDLLAFAPTFKRREGNPLLPFVWKIFEHAGRIYPLPAGSANLNLKSPVAPFGGFFHNLRQG